MDLYIQSAILSVIGGVIYAACANLLLPFFKVPMVSIRKTLIAMSAVALIFWITWMLPQVVLLTLHGLSMTIIFILTAMFLSFLTGMLAATWVLGKFEGADGVDEDYENGE